MANTMEPCFLKLPRGHEESTPKWGCVTIPGIILEQPAISDNSNIQPPALILASWSLLLRSYVGSDNICFGYQIDGLWGKHDEQPIGTGLGRTLIWHSQHRNEDLIEDILRTAQSQFTEGLLHQSPRDDILEQLAQFFNSKVLLGSGTNKTPLGNEDLNSISSETGRQDDIVLDARNLSSKEISIWYRSSKISESQVLSVSRTFSNIFRVLVQDVRLHLGDVDLLSPSDHKQIWEWNETLSEPLNLCVHEILETQTRLTPDKIAINSWDGQFSYQGFDEMSTRLAHHLVNHCNVRVETMVAFAFEKSRWAAVAMTAVMKAGGISVPLNPNDPTLRQEEIMKDVDAQIVICSPGLQNIISRENRTFVVIDETFCNRLPFDTQTPCSDVRPGNGVLLVFTSGSTGKPKAIIQEHSAMSTSVRDHGAAMRMTSHARTYQFSAYTFDTSVSDMFGTFLRGGCVCMPSDHDRMNDLANSINSLGANLTCLTPAVVDQLWPEEVPGLEVLCVGGEALTQAIVDRWAEKVHLINVYGVTECLVWCMATGSINREDSPANMGKNVCGRAWIARVDDYNKLAPIGGVGELLIEGPNLARHYYNNPVKTHESFVNTPQFLQADGLESSTRVYRTGDLVQYSSDGTINYIGRRDSQVKLGGHRVNFGEIEHHIKGLLAAKAEVVCDVMASPRGDKLLIACLSLRDDLDNQTPEWQTRFENLTSHLRRALTALLPAYMVPHHYFHLPQMPLTSSGKMDRKKVVRLASESASSSPIVPGTPLQTITEEELQLQMLWADIFKISPANIHTESSFLNIGDSIAAMKLVSAARRKGYSLTVADIFQCPILSDMAGRMKSRVDSSPVREVEAPQPFSMLADSTNIKENTAMQCKCPIEAIEDIYPCSPLQEGLMALSLKQPGSFIAQDVLYLRPSTDLARFQMAWESVFKHNAILRSRLLQQKSGMVQAVIKESIVWLTGSDLQSYLRVDKERHMCLGDKLTRFGLIISDRTSILVFTRHHSTYDGFFTPLIYDQVQHVYLGSILSPATEFKTFIKHLVNADKHGSENFWRSELADATATDFPPRSESILDPETSKTLSFQMSFGKTSSPDFTMSTLFRAAWALLVSKYSGSNDVIIGTTLSGRAAPVTNIDTIMGPTITTLPVRVHINHSMTVSGYLKQLQDQSTAMMPHEHFGLQNIRRLGEAAESACSFQSLLVIQPERSTTASIIFASGAEPEALEEKRTNALTLQVWPNPGGAKLMASYDPRAFNEEQLQRLLQQYEYIVQQLCALEQPCLVKDVEFLTSFDQDEILRWNLKEPQEFNTCMHHVFEQNVASYPNAAAISAWDGQLTYYQLDHLSSKLAHYLVNVGVVPEVKVPFCFEKSVWAIVAIMAIIKAGGAYVALDPSHPPERLRAIVEDVGAPLILSSAATRKLCSELAQVVCIINKVAIDNMPNFLGTPQTLVTSNNALYVQYTSGTTGRPKGTVIQHNSYCTAFRGHCEPTRIHRNSRVLQFASYSFDVANQDILTTLMAGACLCIPSDDERHENLTGSIGKYRVNNANLTPSVAKLLSPSEVPTLEVLQLSGEAMTVDLINTWGSQLNLINGYGPSECCCVCSINPSPAGNDARNIGSAAGCRLWIVDMDNHERLAPIGAIGELAISGSIVGRGYLNDAEKTQATFVDRPAWLKPGSSGDGRVYKSGDLVRYSLDGTITYVSRKDHQVKLRGQRIELGEIEFQLMRCIPAASHIVVEIVKPSDSKNRSLVAFVRLSAQPDNADFPEAAASLMADALTKAIDGVDGKLSQVLPSYMIPSAFVPVVEMPLTMSRKIDRRKLQAIASKLTLKRLFGLSPNRASNRTLLTAMERSLRAAWGNILDVDVEAIDINGSFIRLGGDSIDAIRLVSLLRAEGLILSVADIFRYPRLSDLSLTLREDNSERSNSELAPFALISSADRKQALVEAASSICQISSDKIEDVYLCTPLQQGMIALSMIQPGKIISCKKFTLPSAVDVVRFKAAWETVVQYNRILRTRVVQVESELFQVVTTVPVEWEKGGEEDGQQNIRLGDPLVQVAIIQSTESGSYEFCLKLHHCVYDGWSLDLILNQFEGIYHGREISRPTPFSSFINYVYSEDRFCRSELFWKSYFDGASPDIFPMPTSAGGVVRPDTTISTHFCLPKTSQSEVTTSTILRGAWAIMAAAYTGNDDVVYGATVSGRNAPLQDIDRITGPTIATVPIRVKIDYQQRIVDFLHDLQQQFSDMIPFEQLGLQNIRRVSPDAELGCSFQTILVIQSTASPRGDSGVLGDSESADDMADFNTYGLMIECQIHESGVTLNANFDKSLIDELQMKRILAQFGYVATQLCFGDPDQCLGRIEMVLEEEKGQLAAWESMDFHPVQCSIHSLISQWAWGTPGHQAIESWDGSMTHGELDTLSTRLGSHLVDLGVQPGVFVPLCFGKSLWTIVAMLAVLKAGGAFVPLDTSHPVTRLESIVQETRAKLILCSEEQMPLFRNTPAATFVVDVSRLSGASQGTQTKLPEVLPQDPAYCLFTSGTTGKPKGVIIEHAAFCTSAKAQGDLFSLGLDSRVLQFASYSFDISLFEILTTLIVGGCVCIPMDEERRDPQAISAAIARMAVNTAGLTPSYIDVMSPSNIPTVTTLILGGEALKKIHIDTWADSVNLMSAYGPTECSVSCSINNDMSLGTDPRNIGRGAGAARWIVDPQNSDRLRPIGAVGELVIEGPLLARGYLNNLEKEREVFVQGPAFLGVGIRRRYKTGDLVRYNHDGTMTYVSRKDNQVKLRGQRLEVEEVEHHISSYDSTMGCAVFIPKSGAWERQLVAMLAIADSSTTNGEQIGGNEMIKATTMPAEFVRKQLDGLTDYLSSNIPQAMIPTMWIIVQAIPFTKSMKLDRAAMEKYVVSMDEETQRAARALTQSNCDTHDWSKSELIMRGMWSRVLNIPADGIAINGNFFRLGGDSISAMQLVDLIRSKNLSLSVADAFKNPQLSSMSRIAQEGLTTSNVSEIPAFSMLSHLDLKRVLFEASQACAIEQHMVEDIYPCTPLQEGLMVLSNGRPGAYMVQHVEHIPRDIDIDKFRAAWDHVAKSHHILRTRIFQSILGVTLQVVENGGLDWAYSDDLYRYLEEDLALPMNFGEPLTRLAIINESPDTSYFVMTAHHSSFDGQSLPRILQRVLVEFQNGTYTEPTPFKYFIKYLSSISPKASEEYWSSNLEDCVSQNWPPLPSLSYQPLDNASIFRDILFKRPLNSAFTSSTMIRAAWSILLAKYSGTRDVVFGATLTGRNSPVEGIAHMPGPTITTVPLRIIIRDESVEELLQRIQDESVAMIPFEQTGLQKIRHMSPSAMVACEFQTLLSIIPAPHEDVRSSIFNSPSTPRIKESDASLTYAITMFCELGASTTRLKASFDSQCVSHKQIERILHQMEHILLQLCSEEIRPQTLVKDIESISPFDKMQLGEWNQAMPPKSEDLILDRVRAIARDHPHSAAIDAWDGVFTYGDLDSISSQLALQLVQAGIGPGHIIPLCFEKSKWNIVAMLGVMKSGAAFNPLDPSQPRNRLRKLIEITGAKTILCSSANLELCQDVTDDVIEVSSNSISTREILESTKLPQIEFTTDLYVLFTSGSTGTPKGVVIQHGPMATSAEAHGPTLGISRSSRILQFSGHTWDVSILDIITSLSHGACICIPSDFDRLNNLPRFVNESRVNFMSLTPSVAQTLSPSELPNVKSLAVLGESWGQGIMDIWAGKVKIFNVYGPTEASVLCTVTEVDPDNYRKNNLGFAVGACLWVADPNDHHALMPIGAVGELLLEGSILGKGYLNEPVKTAQSFVARPRWSTSDLVPGRSPPQRLYRTGDLVRYEDDGTLRFEGRKDAQIKVRGQRLELEEVEHHVSADSLIQSALVSYPKSGLLKGQLVAVVCLVKPALESSVDQEDDDATALKPSVNPSAPSICQQVRNNLSNTLAEYMVPSLWLTVEKMPLLISTKIARNLLNAWILSMTPESLETFSAMSKQEADESSFPKTETERIIQTVWSEVLNIPKEAISTSASFTSLGGDSVLAMLVVSRCRAKRVIISVRDMLLQRTISKLASVAQPSPSDIHKAQSDGIDTRVVESEKLSRLTPEVLSGLGISTAAMVQDVFLCLPTQQEMLACQLVNRDFYRVQGIFKLNSSMGLIDVNRLQQAWTQLVARHGALRSRFTNQLSGNGEMHQIVLKEPLFHFSSFQSETSESAVKELNDLVLSSITVPFSVAVCTTVDGHTFCKLEANHAIIDHTSFGILLGELQQAYVTGQPHSHTAGPSYASFVNHSKLQQTPASTEYWTQYLEGSQCQPFPVLSPQAAQTYQSTPIPLPNLHHLRSFCESHHLTLFNLVQTAWALLLRHHTRSPDVSFCYLLSQRDAPVEGAAEIVGLMLNVLPARLVFLPDSHSRDLDVAFAVRDQFADALRHAYAAFPRGGGAGGRAGLDTLINYRGRLSDAEMERGGPLTFEAVGGWDPMHYTLVLAVEESGEGTSFVLSYWEPRVTAEYADAIVADFKDVLARLTAKV